MAEQAAIQDAWTEIAPGYDEFVTPSHMDLAEAALQRVGLRAEMRMLDVAAGTGALSIPAARRGAQVLATDIAPAMIERLQERARADGLTNLEGRVMNGQSLDLEDDTFDIAGSQFGVMLFPDLPRGFSEMVRVTSPGGRVLVVVFGNPAEVEFLDFFTHAMRSTVPDFEGLSMDPLPLPFQASDPSTLSQRLQEAGLEDVHVETVTEEMEFRSGRGLWDWLMNSNPIPGVLIADTTEDQRAAAREALDGMLRERAGDGDTAVITNPVHIGIGTK